MPTLTCIRAFCQIVILGRIAKMVVIPEIKDYHSADIENVWTWEPNDLGEIYFNLELTIGAKGQDAGDIFQITASTPEGLRNMQKHIPTIQIQKLLLIMEPYRWESILDYCKTTVNHCTGDTWDKVVNKLCRYFYWEYENHEYVSG